MRGFVVCVGVMAAAFGCERQVPQGAEAERLSDYKPKELVRPSMDAMRYYAQASSRVRPAQDQVKELRARVASGLVLSATKAAALDALAAALAKSQPLLAPLTSAGAAHWERLRDVAEPAVVDVERLLKVLNDTP